MVICSHKSFGLRFKSWWPTKIETFLQKGNDFVSNQQRSLVWIDKALQFHHNETSKTSISRHFARKSVASAGTDFC